jgi:RNA polymerase sigma factor (sigma-70 family)
VTGITFITKAISRMTLETTFMNSLMNSPSATDCAGARYFPAPEFAALARFQAKWAPVRMKKTRLNENLERNRDCALTERIVSDIGDFGLRIAMAGHRAVAALATISRPAESASGRMAAPARSGGANDTLVRFQRDIVPQLDAAYNFARFLSRDADAAQDIVQEAFLRAYRSFDGYQGGDARAWIFAIVRNCYHNWLLDRRRKAVIEVDVHSKDNPEENAIDNVPSDEDSPETSLLRRAESGAVRLVLNRLPRPLREILVLRELEGLSYRQIAEIAGLPIGTVMSRLARARTQFESAWRQETRNATENPT